MDLATKIAIEVAEWIFTSIEITETKHYKRPKFKESIKCSSFRNKKRFENPKILWKARNYRTQEDIYSNHKLIT